MGKLLGTKKYYAEDGTKEPHKCTDIEGNN
jgi:hypothetical protein